MNNSNTILFAKLMDIIFISSIMIFNVFVSLIYLSTKLGNIELLRVSGLIVILLIIPFSLNLIGYIKEKVEMKIVISLAIILFYLFIELLLDYILVIPFRDIIAIHIPYIIIFYAAEFCMIGVAFDISKKMGFLVLATFGILIGCLIYLYTG